MIEEINLDGFTAAWEAKYERKGQEYGQSHFSNIKKNGLNSTYIAREPTIFCMRGFFYISYRSGMVPGPGEL